MEPLSSRSLAIDPFSFPNDTVVHYLVNKNDIIKIVQVFNANHTKNVAAGGASKSINTTALNFALTPFSWITQISISSDIPTNIRSIHAALSWSPNPCQTPDFTRNGVATGYVVVPEFPTMTSMILMIGALLGTLMILQQQIQRK